MEYVPQTIYCSDTDEQEHHTTGGDEDASHVPATYPEEDIERSKPASLQVGILIAIVSGPSINTT
jgi:hypothetical protein